MCLALASACGGDDGGAADAGPTLDASPDAWTSCADGDLRFAPPPRVALGFEHVAIDVASVDVAMVFDVEAQRASASATVAFDMGDDAGNPTFDLRQIMTAAEIDGVPIDDPNWAMRYHDFGSGTLRSLDQRLEACSSHELTIEYEVDTPLANSQGARGPAWGTGEVEWGFKLYDVWTARLLEQWAPVGLMYDRFDFTFDVEIANATAAHTLITNGDADELGPTHWRIAFPSHFTSQSPLVEIVPADRLTTATSDVQLPGGATVTLDVYQHTDIADDVANVLAFLEEGIVEFATSDGAYLHGDRFTAFVLDDAYQAEEYEGATTTHAGRTITRHELYHSWYGRGVSPATFNDSWFDESWVVAVVDTPEEGPLLATDPPVVLHTDDPWLRELRTDAYSEGARMFLSLGEDIGAEVLADLMAQFVADNALERVTTGDLQRHLYCGAGDDAVLFWFHRFVYGLDGEAPAAPAGYCD